MSEPSERPDRHAAVLTAAKGRGGVNRILRAAVAATMAMAVLTGAHAPAPPGQGPGGTAGTAGTAGVDGSTGAAGDSRPGRYTNAVSAGFADTFADPAVIRGHDGAWYAYGTSDPLREGEGTAHRLPIARSDDLVHWAFAGDAFDGGALPPYADSGALLWAPDIRYLDGHYVMYFTVTDTTDSPGDFDPAIGVATAPAPTGPWTIADQPAVPPRRAGDGHLWTIDPAQLTGADGRKYIYWGSYGGGVWVSELSADGLRAVGTPTKVGAADRFEGSFVVRRGGFYYLFASSANCCAGPTTGYSVSVGRATDPRGPFVDRDGIRLDASRPGGTPVIWPTGNAWIGTGHNAITTDLAGQDWFVYHAIDRADPFLDEPYGINERPMLVDRLDWIDGWPLVRAGAGASTGPETAPVTRGVVQDGFASGRLSPRWRASGGGWAVNGTGDPAFLRRTGGGTARLVAADRVPADRRVETDLRLPAAAGAAGGIVVADGAAVRVDAGRLTVEIDGDRGPVRAQAALASGGAAGAGTATTGTWHNLAVEVRGRTITARLTPARLGDPIAEVTVTAPRPLPGPVGVLAEGGPVDFDNVSAAPLYRPVTRAVEPPRVGPPLAAHSDEFDGDAPGPGWSWIRRDPAATVSGGALRWPVQGSDLVGEANTAGVLARTAPRGDYVVETKLGLDLGEETVRNYQQAGLVAYVDDDEFARLCHVAIGNTRQVEFGRELSYAGRLSYGGNQFGTPAATTWLRLAHRVDPANGEHEFRAGTSRDGRHWTWGGVWTFPAATTPRIGLVAQGGAEPAVTAEFDYVRFYRG